jgi:DNA-binding MarR family transcriptional regulator
MTPDTGTRSSGAGGAGPGAGATSTQPARTQPARTDPTEANLSFEADLSSLAEECLAFLVRHAWLSMRTVIAAVLAEHDLSVAQYASLLKLADEPGLSPAAIARAMASTRQAANQMLAGLERAGLIERTPHPSDRRTQRFFLTAAGAERLRAAAPAVRAVEQDLEAGVSPDEAAVVRAWLVRMARASSPSVEEFPTS